MLRPKPPNTETEATPAKPPQVLNQQSSMLASTPPSNSKGVAPEAPKKSDNPDKADIRFEKANAQGVPQVIQTTNIAGASSSGQQGETSVPPPTPATQPPPTPSTQGHIDHAADDMSDLHDGTSSASVKTNQTGSTASILKTPKKAKKC